MLACVGEKIESAVDVNLVEAFTGIDRFVYGLEHLFICQVFEGRVPKRFNACVQLAKNIDSMMQRTVFFRNVSYHDASDLDRHPTEACPFRRFGLVVGLD